MLKKLVDEFVITYFFGNGIKQDTLEQVIGIYEKGKITVVETRYAFYNYPSNWLISIRRNEIKEYLL